MREHDADDDIDALVSPAGQRISDADLSRIKAAIELDRDDEPDEGADSDA